MKNIVLGVLIVVYNLKGTCQSAAQFDIKWKEDIDYLHRFVANSHKNPYHVITKRAFDSSVNHLNSRIKKLNRIQLITELGKIIACIGDGHTRLQFFRPEVHFHLMPIRLYYYEDGVFIQAIDSSMAWAVGAEVIKIGNTPISDAMKTIATVTSADNLSGVKEYAAKYASIPDLLYGLNISDDSLKCNYTILAKDGKTHTIQLRGEAMTSSKDFLSFEPFSKRYVRDRDSSSNPVPEYLANSRYPMSLKLISGKDILYVQVNEIRNDPSGQRLSEFFTRAVKLFDSTSSKKFVLDLRLNRGGDASLLRPIIHLITGHSVINKRGNFYTIIGRRTFSAAGQFVTELVENTNVILVGEPSGTGPNRYGETGETNLPNSDIIITVSTQWIQRGRPEDKSKFFGPELYAPLTSHHYKANIDPAFEIIEIGSFDSSIYERLLVSLESDIVTLKAFKVLFTKLISNKLYAFYDFESTLQRLALLYMRKNKYMAAENILMILTAYRPVTTDTYEILSDICEAAGDSIKQLSFLSMALKQASGYQQFILSEKVRRLKLKKKN